MTDLNRLCAYAIEHKNGVWKKLHSLQTKQNIHLPKMQFEENNFT